MWKTECKGSFFIYGMGQYPTEWAIFFGARFVVGDFLEVSFVDYIVIISMGCCLLFLIRYEVRISSKAIL